MAIGDSVIVGACTLVNKGLLSGGVYAGDPAGVIKSLEEYGEKSLAKEGALNIKGLSAAEKQARIRELRPEWFETK